MRFMEWRFAGHLAMAAMMVMAVPVGSHAAEKLRFVFPAPPTTFELPYFVAEKKGFMGDLQIDEIYVNGNSNAFRAVISGSADIAIDGTANALLGVEQGAKIKVIGSYQPVQDYNLIIGTGKGDKIGDLAGKVFASTGPGNIPDVLSRLLFKLHHVDVSKITYITVTNGHAGMLAAVAAGRADGALVNTVTAEQGARSGQVKVLLQVAKELPTFGYTYIVVPEASLGNPALSQEFAAVVSGAIQASRYIMDHPDEAAEILHERVPAMDRGFLTAVIRQLNEANVWGVNGGIERENVAQTIKIYREADLIHKDLAVSDVFDYRYVDAALAKLGKK